MKTNRKNTKSEQVEDVQETTTEQTQTLPEFKNVFVLTNTKNNSIKSLYVSSLATSIKLALFNNIKVFPIFISNIDSVPMAKNELLNNLKDVEYDSVVFINDDLAWDPVTFVSCILNKEDVIAVPVVKKTLGNVIFDLDMDVENIEKNEGGLIKVKSASTGFMKLSNKVLTELLDGSNSITNNTGNEVKNVFEYEVKDGQFLNESIVLCHKIKDMGYDVWLNPTSTCGQLTDNLYAVDFASALEQNLNPQVPETESTEEETVTETVEKDEVKSLYE
jgi:hypothetical protein